MLSPTLSLSFYAFLPLPLLSLSSTPASSGPAPPSLPAVVPPSYTPCPDLWAPLADTCFMSAATAGGAAEAFQTLHVALGACDEASPDGTAALTAWVAMHGPNCAVKVQDTDYGSPLYIACVADCPQAVQVLLALGANPEYTHPAPHGDTPALHCAHQGYGDCLQALMACPGLDLTAARTRDFKVVLGQGVPQYEAGGQSALLLAAVAGHVDVVRLLLDDGAYGGSAHGEGGAGPGTRMLHGTDSFGRSVLEAVLDGLVLTPPDRPMRSALQSVACVLCEALGLPEDEIPRRSPTPEVWSLHTALLYTAWAPGEPRAWG